MTSVSTILRYLEYTNKNCKMDQNGDTPQRAKKRRLDHLSWEEKIQRKKLKNRVAAQTSRDRKKAKMEQMEQAVQQLFSQNETLLAEIQSLKESNERLTKENAELYGRLEGPCPSCDQNRTVGCKAPNGSTESLLQPKGRAIHPAAALTSAQATALWKIVLSCLLYQTCSMSSTAMSTLTRWSNSRRASCRISPGTWKLLLRRQIVKNQSAIDRVFLESWWGSQQHNWNPPVKVKG